MSLFESSLAKLPSVKDADGNILTEPFLDIGRLVLPVVEQFGVAFFPVKADMGGNIDRLHRRYETDPARFERIFEIIEDEVARNDYDHSQSCTKGLLWLKRALEFMMAILQRLYDDADTSLSEVVNETYHATIAQWHGWIITHTFTLAFKFVPSREAFLAALAGTGGDAARGQMHDYLQQMAPLLAEVHAYLDSKGLDDPAKV